MVTVARSHSVRQAQLNRLHLDLAVPYTSYISLSPSEDSPASSVSYVAGGSSTRGSSPANAQDSPSPTGRTVICSVLCVYDYSTTESHCLSFRQGEILEVVKQESTGWWAAQRQAGDPPGWIPQAFVRHLTPEMADRYRGMQEELRMYDYNAEQLYDDAPVSRTSFMDAHSDPTTSTVTRNHSTRDTRPPRPSSPLIRKAKSRDVLPTGLRREILFKQPSQARLNSESPPTPPSPTSPMPQPPPPLRSAPIYNKPVPPLPDEVSNFRIRAGSLSSRSIRRKPLLLDDNTALSRLSTLIETKNSREIDKYANPDITGSVNALSSRQRMQQQKSFQPLENPWYTLPCHADQLDFDNHGQVRSGSLLGLVERLTTSAAFLEWKDRNGRSYSYASVFLMTFMTFTTPDELFDLLLDRFSMTRPDNLSPSEVVDWKTKCLQPTQRNVLAIFTLWLENHRLLEDAKHIAQRLPDFVTHVAMPLLPSESRGLMATLDRLMSAESTKPPMPGVTPRKPRKTKAHKNDLLRLDPSDIAEQLTLLEYGLYSKLTPRDFLTYTKTQKGDSVAQLRTFCRTYDQLAGWVKLSILTNEAIAKRAATIEFWIKAAEKCRQLHNYPSMSSIISALSSTVITKLHLTWAHVGRKSQYDALLKYNDPTGGFAAYRLFMGNIDKTAACVPFITMYLTDLVRTKEQYSDEPDRICFLQRQRWHETITTILLFQRRQYLLLIDEQIATFVRNHLTEATSKDNTWFWSRSQQLQQTELTHADIRKGLEQAGF
ncbi:ras GEF [Coprinopsis marcescibilis]|uniref:Ras GEF n=1 Tax=Coprinopsis marcescibilis TaxID=230819 RepID=A0A5C3L1V8_COPMA|nr:ras GEF [Coprinopsis marcescibilis]